MQQTRDSRLTRRQATIGAGAVGAALLAGSARAAGGKSAPPNVVFILADDLGFADVSCNGSRHIRTPNIDSIAAGGARLTQAYANSAVCSATRSALITGRYQYRLPMGLEEPLAGREQIGLPPQQPTLPSLFRQAGYATTLIGKWHLGGPPKFGPRLSGYDHFYGIRGGALDYYTHAVGTHEDLWDDAVPVHKTGYLTDLFGDRAVEVIDGHAKAGQPFLLSLHFNAPHWPWEAPGDEAEALRLQAMPGREAIWDFDGGTLDTYRRMVERMDLQIGRVLGALDAHGLAQNTIVVFTSDNGGERFSETWPFTGRKTELLEGGLRIPAVIRWPARIEPGREVDQVCMSMDWLPTFLEAAGLAADPTSPPDGVSLGPVLWKGAASTPRQVFWRYKANAQRAMRDGDLKILKIAGNTFLFDVVADPMERANLKARRPGDYARMVAAWNDWNRTMLPEDPMSHTDAFDSSQLADHVGSRAVGLEVDDVSRWPARP